MMLQDGKRFKGSRLLYLGCILLVSALACLGIMQYLDYRTGETLAEKLHPYIDVARQNVSRLTMGRMALELERVSIVYPEINDHLAEDSRNWLCSFASGWFLSQSRRYLSEYRKGALESKLGALVNARRVALCCSLSADSQARTLFRDINLPKIVSNSGNNVVVLTESHTLVIGKIPKANVSAGMISDGLNLQSRIVIEGVYDVAKYFLKNIYAVIDKEGNVYFLNISHILEIEEKVVYKDSAWQGLNFATRIPLHSRFVSVSAGLIALTEDGDIWNLNELNRIFLEDRVAISLRSAYGKNYAILGNGGVAGWGGGLKGYSIGFGRDRRVKKTKILPELQNVVDISATVECTLFLCADGAVYQCGYNPGWNLENPDVPFPEMTLGTGKCIAVKCRAYACYAIGIKGNFMFWGGSNSSGSLETPNEDSRAMMNHPLSNRKLLQIKDSYLALTANHEILYVDRHQRNDKERIFLIYYE